MRISRFTDSGEGVPLQRPLGQRPAWTKTPLEKDHPGQRSPRQRPRSGQRHPLDKEPWTKTSLDRDPLEGTWDQGQRPPRRTWDQAVTQEVTSYTDHPRGHNERRF